MVCEFKDGLHKSTGLEPVVYLAKGEVLQKEGGNPIVNLTNKENSITTVEWSLATDS